MTPKENLHPLDDLSARRASTRATLNAKLTEKRTIEARIAVAVASGQEPDADLSSIENTITALRLGLAQMDDRCHGAEQAVRLAYAKAEQQKLLPAKRALEAMYPRRVTLLETALAAAKARAAIAAETPQRLAELEQGIAQAIVAVEQAAAELEAIRGPLARHEAREAAAKRAAEADARRQAREGAEKSAA